MGNKDYFEEDYFFGRKLSNYHNYNEWDNDLFWKSVLKSIKKYHIHGKYLDVGCAFGFLVKRVLPYFEEAHGVDISNYAIEKAKKVAPEARFELVDLDVNELPFQDDYFDLITAMDVLEHTKSFSVSLDKIIRKLKKGGVLFLSVPISNGLFAKIFHRIDKDRTHISIPTTDEIFSEIKKNNINILEKRYFLNAAYFKLRGIPVDVELILRKK